MVTTGASDGCTVTVTEVDAVRVASYTVTVRTATTPGVVGDETVMALVCSWLLGSVNGHWSDTDGCVCTHDHTYFKPAALPVTPGWS